MNAQTTDWATTIVSLLVGVFGTLGGTAWLRRRLGKDSVLSKAVKSAGRSAVAEVMAPEITARLDANANGLATLTNSVTSLDGRLRDHLEWEERERLNDIEHRRLASAERCNQFTQIATRLDALDARMATVEHAAQ